MPICGFCGEEFPNYVKINGKGMSVHKRVYCFKCKPYGSKSSKSLKLRLRTTYRCTKCKQEKPNSAFYIRKKTGLPFSVCKECSYKTEIHRMRVFKELCIAHKGGRCQDCGYSRCPWALEFHHRNPKAKKFNFATSASLKLTEFVLEELDKCDLLCGNCHREREHTKAVSEGRVRV